MKMVKIIDSLYIKGQKGEIIPMYSLSEIEAMDNVSDYEIEGCRQYSQPIGDSSEPIGFVEEEDSRIDNKTFIQVYDYDVEEIIVGR